MNGIRSDNRIANLRMVSHRLNVENEQNHRKNKSGLPTGASKVKESNRFFSQIVANGKTVYLGTFATAEAASAAYFKAKAELHEGYLGHASSINRTSEELR